jgi:hypothetical protein
MKKIFGISLVVLIILTSCHKKERVSSIFGSVENVYMTDESHTSSSISLKGVPRIYTVYEKTISVDDGNFQKVFHMIKPGDKVTFTYDACGRVHGVINFTTNQNGGENLNEVK